MVRLIATDMDGTLLNSRHRISDKNKKAIEVIKEKGIKLVIATGRSFPEAIGPIKGAGFKLPYICINGAEVRDENENLIAATYMTRKDANDAIAILKAQDIYYDLFIDKYVYAKDIERQIKMFLQVGFSENLNPHESDIRKAVMDRFEKGFIRLIDSDDNVIKRNGKSIYKILGICNNDHQFITATKILRNIPGLAISSSGKGIIEITDSSAQKGVALERYAKSMGILMVDVMVIGDSFNDISMMERAGRSVAMGNAPEEIKEICTHQTDTSDNDGFALAIETIL